ncbi:hypothetical protein BJ165DRAFT_1404085 [Panaeolus papilionaceus]|nr:hypothetical protein BJ165DRAFT_1404085 [Panaeolus papilionaceus]
MSDFLRMDRESATPIYKTQKRSYSVEKSIYVGVVVFPICSLTSQSSDDRKCDLRRARIVETSRRSTTGQSEEVSSIVAINQHHGKLENLRQSRGFWSRSDYIWLTEVRLCAEGTIALTIIGVTTEMVVITKRIVERANVKCKGYTDAMTGPAC